MKNRIIDYTNDVIAYARANELPVVFVRAGFSCDYLECPENSSIFSKAKQLEALQLNTWATELHENLHVQSSDLIITKHRVSAFYGTA